MVSTEVHVALAPDKTYRALIAVAERVSTWRMLRRPLLVSVAIGTAVPIMAVQRMTIGLLASSTLSFVFAVAVQMVVGAGLIASAPSRRVTMTRALDLWFAGHAPYSLWLLLVAAVFAALPAAGPMSVGRSATTPRTIRTIRTSRTI